MDPDVARKSTAPGDVIVTEHGQVDRVVDHLEDAGYRAVCYQTGADPKIVTRGWERAAGYTHRDDVDDPLALRDGVDVQEEDGDDGEGEDAEDGDDEGDE